MKQTRSIMGMPVTVEIADPHASGTHLDAVFAYFTYVDEKFSTYKETSEITLINKGELKEADYSEDMKKVFALSEKTRRETDGYFNILSNGKYDPSGLVKGWAILNAARLIESRGFADFYVDAGGDIETRGKNGAGKLWRVGIRDPFNKEERIVKTVAVGDGGVATSGTYLRGQHIYDPRTGRAVDTDIVSLTVIGPNIYEADRFATAAFAMRRAGIDFIESRSGLEGYIIAQDGIATVTRGFDAFVVGADA